MCGRYVLKEDAPTLTAYLGLGAEDPVVSDYCATPHFNLAPTQDVLAVRSEAASSGIEAALLHWGLVPSWAKEVKMGARMINARSETVFEKPAFRSAIRKRRCVFPASGFFEWRREGDRKQPYYFRRRTGEPMLFAGIWEHWHGQESVLESGSILTISANEAVEPVHDRMPVLLEREEMALWLDPGTPEERLRAVLTPCLPEWIESYPVSTRVNSPRHDDKGNLEPVVT